MVGPRWLHPSEVEAVNPPQTVHRCGVAVLGATGFLGGHVMAALERDGLEAIAVPRAALAGDLDAALAGARAVVNLAAAGVSPKVASPEALRTINELLPARIVEAMGRAGIATAVMAGTAVEYGRSADRYEHIPPDAPLEPVSDYARSKVDGFLAAAAAALEHGVTLHHLRVFNAYGPGQDMPALWPSLEHAARTGGDLDLSSGTQVRDFVPVEQVADAFARAVATSCADEAEATAMAGSGSAAGSGSVHVRNIGTGRGVSVRDFATGWWERWAAPGQLRFGVLPDRGGETRRLVADVEQVQVITRGGPTGAGHAP